MVIVVSGKAITPSPAAQRNVTSFYPATPSMSKPSACGLPFALMSCDAWWWQGCLEARGALVGCMGKGMEEAGVGSACRLGLSDWIIG